MYPEISPLLLEKLQSELFSAGLRNEEAISVLLVETKPGKTTEADKKKEKKKRCR